MRRHLLLAALCLATLAHGSDHLDTPTVIADPAADIGDLYAWTSPGHLNLAMTVVGAKFSDQLRYTFHIDSGRRLGATTHTLDVVCKFDTANAIDCRAANDRASGDASAESGLVSRGQHLRVFAGLRDDPFFNNVRGTRAALNVAGAALPTVSRDAAGCPQFDAPTAARIADEWRHTEGHDGTNFLAGWKTAALVVSIDLPFVTRGGAMLGVWATTSRRDGAVIDRMGRALTGNALIETFGTEDAANRRKEQYNRAVPAGWPAFAPDLAVNLAIYDGFDGHCGNQWMVVQNAAAASRYAALAKLLADDRLWIKTSAPRCSQYLAAEFDWLGATNDDCGGRTPAYDAVDTFRALLANGTLTGLEDGVDRDDRATSDAVFPFLAAP
ncbi:MAG TPA: DUF4331 family protein [Steroidobacteraceae bacterium]|nr:DUF4331 family protein [Steroidobacteraceae bacterium]